MTNHPQHLEPHAIGVPCQRHVPLQANTLPVLPEIRNEVEACNVRSPNDLQQATSSNSRGSRLASVAIGSLLPGASENSCRPSDSMAECSSTSGKRLLTSWSGEPESAPVDFRSTASLAGIVSESIPHGVTTLIIRNVPARYSKEKIMQEWPPDGTYDFLYLPFCFKQKRYAGVAFVNFTTHEAAVHFHGRWNNKSLRYKGTSKRLRIGVSEAQGLEQNLEHLVTHNISRIQQSKFLPSAFNGTEEVPLEGLLERITGSATTGER